MKHARRLQVEVYSHGGWWKDSNGRTGQVPEPQMSKGPVATVAAVANGYGTDGWMLTDIVNGHHNSYILSFELSRAVDRSSEVAEAPLSSGASINLG